MGCCYEQRNCKSDCDCENCLREFNATTAWQTGYGYAVRGIVHMPRGTWLSAFAADWKAGYEAAKQDGWWGAYE